MNVLVLLPVDDAQRERLEAAAPEASFIYADQRAVTPEQVADAEVIVGNLAPARLVEAPCLRFLQLHSAGYDNYVTAPMATGARVACASGAYGQAVSEHMLAMVLAQISASPPITTTSTPTPGRTRAASPRCAVRASSCWARGTSARTSPTSRPRSARASPA